MPLFVVSYGFSSLLVKVPPEEERLGGAGLLPAQPEAAVEALDVGEDALPVGLLHADHVLHVEQGADVAVFPARIIAFEVTVPTSINLQGVPCPRRLGFVDLDLGCSTNLLGL